MISQGLSDVFIVVVPIFIIGKVHGFVILAVRNGRGKKMTQKLDHPYNRIYECLQNASYPALNIQRKDAIDWQLINLIEKAVKLLETNEYFSYGKEEEIEE